MKIQCDVCSKKEAYVYCTADEAALCDVCDHRVHHANKLASKHERFSLLQPSSSHPPMCDICQERRGVIFCQEDRAILCRECDIPLHSANEYTEKHNRFLLTGMKLSTTSISDTNSNINDGFEDTSVPDFKANPTTSNVTNSNKNNVTTVNSSDSSSDQIISGSNISDYLIETLPGWHFDDFILDPPTSTAPAPAPFAFSKGNDNSGIEVNEDMLSFYDVEQHEKSLNCYYTQSDNIWVPQAPQVATTPSNFGQASIFDIAQNGLIHNNNNGTKHQEMKAAKISRKWITDDAFTVPQITSSNKRTRPFW